LIDQNNEFSLLDAFLYWGFVSGIAFLTVQIGLGGT
jgi:hypothetical protein